MTQFLFRNFQLLNPVWDEVRSGYEVLVVDGEISEVSDRPIHADTAQVIDCDGRTLMPGLIDCHVHAFMSEVNIGKLAAVPLTLMTARGSGRMHAMLNRGFTTVRDAAGADWGLRQAIEEGLIIGPRIFISGRGIGPTGGHSDSRTRTQGDFPCPCCNAVAFQAKIADGVDEVQKAVREEIRQGADAIKIMASGGVASPYDPLDSRQYSQPELDIAVEEAEAFGLYVLAHAYTPEAITRCMNAGVRTIEHGNLVDEASANLMAEKGAYLVANLVAYHVMKERAAQFGMTGDMLEKNEIVLEAGLRSLDICRQAGVPVAYGSDLLGELENEQSREFMIRQEVCSSLEIIRSATTIGAEVIRQEGKLGVIQHGAIADLLLVDGNPLDDLSLLQGQGAHLPLIMKGGALHKNQL